MSKKRGPLEIVWSPLAIGSTPYSILYRIRGNRLIISTISHASQSK
jgi:hypothetical protein